MSWTIKFRAKKTGLALKYVPPSQYSYTKKALIPFVLFDIQWIYIRNVFTLQPFFSIIV